MALSDGAAVALAMFGPSAAGFVWLLVSSSRPARRVAGASGALISHWAAWLVLSRVYRGEEVAWRGFEPGLLGATLLVVVEIAIAIAIVRAGRGSRAAATGALVATAAAATAVAMTGYGRTLAVLGVATPIATLAVLAAGLTGPRGATKGLAGLAAADTLVLAGLSVAFAEAGSSQLHPPGPGAASLILAGAALKIGAVPGFATARIAAGEGPASGVAVAIRGQGAALAAVPLVAGSFDERTATAVVAAGLVLLSGAALPFLRSTSSLAATITAAGAAMVVLAVGLGGTLGVRAFLLTFPVFLLAAATLWSVEPGAENGTPRGGGLGPLVATLCVVSLLGLVPGSVGSWVSLQLASVRAEAEPASAVVPVLVALGMLLTATGVVPLVRTATVRGAGAGWGLAAAAALVYAAVVPVRLGIGWWVRIETELGVPRLVESAGGPSPPAISPGDLALVLAVAGLLGLAIVLAGRGVRHLQSPEHQPLLAAPFAGAAVAARKALERALVLPVAAGLLMTATLVLVSRLILLASQQGFL